MSSLLSFDYEEFEVSPLFVERSDTVVKICGNPLILRRFQRDLYEAFENPERRELIMLCAPTGSGKTLSLLIPLFVNIEKERPIYGGSVGVYPSRELARDQFDSVSNILDKIIGNERRVKNVVKVLVSNRSELDPKVVESINNKLSDCVRVWEADIDGKKYPIVLLYLVSNTLNKMRDVLHRYCKDVRINLDALELLVRALVNRAYTIIFTVPEYLYLISQDIYKEFHSAGVHVGKALDDLIELFASLRGRRLAEWLTRFVTSGIDRYSRTEIYRLRRVFELFRWPLFIDEFHLYSGLSLSSFLSLIFVSLIEIGGIRKIVISSATPEKRIRARVGDVDVLNVVEEMCRILGIDVRKIEERGVSSWTRPNERFDQVRKRTIVKVIGVPTRVSGAPAFGAVQRKVREILDLDEWRHDMEKYGRFMIILDRIASVFEAGRKLYEMTGEKPVAVTSIRLSLPDYLESPDRVDLREAKMIVGNMSIAFGIDIPAIRLGMVFAKDRLSAIQKLGRIGRGEGSDSATVYLVVPSYAMIAIRRFVRQRGGKMLYHELVELLRDVYPAPPREFLATWNVGILRAIASAWLYTLAEMLAHRDAVIDAVDRGRISNVPYLREFLDYVGIIERFFGVRDLVEYVEKYVCLPPESMYELMSFRCAPLVPIKSVKDDEEIVEELDIVAVGRNIGLEIEGGELRIASGGRSMYTDLWIGVSDRKRAEEILRELDGYVVAFYYVAQRLDTEAGANLYQGQRYLCRLLTLARNEGMAKIPVLVMYRRTDEDRKTIEYLAAMQSLMTIYTVVGRRRLLLLGGLYFM